MSRRGFTLLEVVIALAILAMSLMAIFDLNAGAVASHAYAKKLTVATLLARSKMTDVEQELYDQGFASDDEEKSGDFSEEGWAAFKWRAKILAPRTQGVAPDQLIGALFGMPMGEDGELPGGLSAMFAGAQGGSDSAPAPGGAAAAGLAAMGPLAGMATTQMTQLVESISSTVREVHLTISWKEGTQVESIDLVTHVVSPGPGGDRNGARGGAGGAASASNPSGEPMVNARTGAPVANPVPGPNGGMVDPASPQDPVIPMAMYRQQRGMGVGTNPGGGAIPPNLGLPPGMRVPFMPRQRGAAQ
jgi:general secretion pathway protein I